MTDRPAAQPAGGPVVSDLALILAVATTHAGGWIAAEIAVGGIAPFTLAAARFIVAGAVLVVIARWRGSSLGTSNWRALLGVALIGVALSHALFYTGLRLAPAADAVVLSTALAPTLAALLAVPVLGERLSTRAVLGILLSACGVSLVVFDAGSTGGGDRLLGNALVLGGAATTALYTILGRVALRAGTPLGVVGSTTLIGGLMLAPFATLEGPAGLGLPWSTEVWLAFLYLTFPSAILAAVLYYELVRRTGAARAALVAYIVPVFVLGWGTLVFGEPLTLPRVLGAALAIVGVRLVLRSRTLASEDPVPEP